MLTNCSGSCITCACSGVCLAGHGDDDYSVKSKEDLLKTIKDLEIKLKIEEKVVDRDEFKVTSYKRDIELCKEVFEKEYS